MADANTLLLLHCDGADGSTTFTDSSPSVRTVTAVGNAQIDTAQSVFGGASGLFDGTTDYLSFPEEAGLEFGTGNLSVDFRVRFSSVTGGATTQCFFSHSPDANNRFMWSLLDGELVLYCVKDAVEKINVRSNWSPSIDTWYHLAVSKNSGTTKFFVDGVSQTLTTSTEGSTEVTGSTVWRIGDEYAGGGLSRELFGWMDEFRISNSARWTANFTPPTVPYTNPRATVVTLA